MPTHGIGGVLFHIIDNLERPIAYTSRTLNVAGRRYSQIDRESLAIVFTVSKFYKYLFWLKFTLWTDHRPLTFIFKQQKGSSQVVANRLQRYAFFLSSFDFEIKYLKGNSNNVADGSCRVPVNFENVHLDKESTYINLVSEVFYHVDKVLLQKETINNRILSKVIFSVQSN